MGSSPKQAAVLVYIDGFIAAAAGTLICLLLTAILRANSARVPFQVRT
jgi:uncharacterized membrane protein